jgi:hypothetical protein
MERVFSLDLIVVIVAIIIITVFIRMILILDVEGCIFMLILVNSLSLVYFHVSGLAILFFIIINVGIEVLLLMVELIAGDVIELIDQRLLFSLVVLLRMVIDLMRFFGVINVKFVVSILIVKFVVSFLYVMLVVRSGLVCFKWFANRGNVETPKVIVVFETNNTAFINVISFIFVIGLGSKLLVGITITE